MALNVAVNLAEQCELISSQRGSTLLNDYENNLASTVAGMRDGVYFVYQDPDTDRNERAISLLFTCMMNKTYVMQTLRLPNKNFLVASDLESAKFIGVGAAVPGIRSHHPLVVQVQSTKTFSKLIPDMDVVVAGVPKSWKPGQPRLTANETYRMSGSQWSRSVTKMTAPPGPDGNLFFSVPLNTTITMKFFYVPVTYDNIGATANITTNVKQILYLHKGSAAGVELHPNTLYTLGPKEKIKCDRKNQGTYTVEIVDCVNTIPHTQFLLKRMEILGPLFAEVSNLRHVSKSAAYTSIYDNAMIYDAIVDAKIPLGDILLILSAFKIAFVVSKS